MMVLQAEEEVCRLFFFIIYNKFIIVSHLDTIHESNGRTDRQTDTGRQQNRAYRYE